MMMDNDVWHRLMMMVISTAPALDDINRTGPWTCTDCRINVLFDNLTYNEGVYWCLEFRGFIEVWSFGGLLMFGISRVYWSSGDSQGPLNVVSLLCDICRKTWAKFGIIIPNAPWCASGWFLVRLFTVCKERSLYRCISLQVRLFTGAPLYSV